MNIPLFLLALFAHLSITGAMRNGCADAAMDESGNYYCEPAVNTIKYVNISGSGTYKTPSLIEGSDSCVDFIDIPYSGPLAPYNEEITIILRGPLKIRQFAAYVLNATCQGSSLNKRSHAAAHERRHNHHAHHAHQHLHDEAEKKKRGLGDVVVAEIDGELVSWINTYGGTPAPQPPAPEPPAVQPPAVSSPSASPTSVPLPPPPPPPEFPPSVQPKPAPSGTCQAWDRVSYYNSEVRVKEGLTFLTHPDWTNSISYAGPDGTSSANEPTLFNGELKNAGEMFINTDKPCSEDIGTECPYFKEGDKAYHGYGGTKKAFFFEFLMPDTGTHATVGEMASKYVADNMPAIWSLNSRVMTNQYGCNCHESGCGEIDFFEIMNPGNYRLKSTIHGKSGFSGGDSHYIKRPTDSWMSAWVIMDEDKMVLKVVEPNTVAPDSLTQDLLSSIMGSDDETIINIEGKLAVFEVAA
ncbi:putative TOS1-like glycosyl hydrolase-domain-containing protein [Phyllosticta capitalensis]|uniref:glucan endo-1,3-beta-D-glucosidase n=1 Tax=Phyllosticta capitalensis TaxID=121624 RepID=A0ABR1YZ96_9PEZI